MLFQTQKNIHGSLNRNHISVETEITSVERTNAKCPVEEWLFPAVCRNRGQRQALLLEPYITCVQMWQECLQILATRPPPLIILLG